MSARYHVHWVSHSPASYNTQLFRRLAAEKCWDLTVHYEYPQSGAHDWKTDLTSGYRALLFKRKLGIDWDLLRKAITEKNSLFVFAGWIAPTNQLAFLLLALMGRPYAIWNDTPNLTRSRSFLKRAMRSAFLTFVFRHASAVMSTGTPGLRNMAVMGCPESKLVSFPCFIDNDVYAERPPFVPGREIVFGSSGRLASEKGYDLALTALAKVFAGRRDAFSYRIAGTGPDRDKLLRQAAGLGIGDRIEFAGWLDPAEISKFYQATDVFLHPARYEPYGVSVLEAMAAGTTVIGSDAAGAVIDRVVQGKNGLVHRHEDTENLAEQIQLLAHNPQLIGQLGKAARATAEEWPLDRAVELLKRVIEMSFPDRTGKIEA